MPRPITGKITTYRRDVPKGNGYVYVYERTERYDSLKRRMVKVGSEKLLGKYRSDDPERVLLRTRPKKPSTRRIPTEESSNTAPATVPLREPVLESSRISTALRYRIGSSLILDHIAAETGIESDIYALLDKGTAEKLISCARFLVCSANEPLSRIRTWQLTHPIPYEEGLSKDVCHRLAGELGTNETFRQQLFQCRIDRQPADELVVALDGSTVSTYSENQLAARYGFNKSGDGLPTIKWMDLYASRTHEPLAFALQPGNIPDVASIHNTLEQLRSIMGERDIILVTDNGFYSDSNAYELISKGYSFISRVEISTKWLRQRLEKERQWLEKSSLCCDEDGYVVGITKRVFHTFQRKDSEDGVRRICYLHFYLDTYKRSELIAEFNAGLRKLKDQLESGYPLESLAPAAKKTADEFLELRDLCGFVRVTYNDGAIAKAKEDFGIFALLSYGEAPFLSDTVLTFEEYIRREHIEDHFRAEKNTLDGNHVRSWYGENYMGKVMIQFVALCYEEKLWSDIAMIKRKLREDIAQSKKTGKQKTMAGKKQKLLTWLNGLSLHELLSWFDAIERTEVSSQIRSTRWSTEVIERDSMFLKLLGVTIED